MDPPQFILPFHKRLPQTCRERKPIILPDKQSPSGIHPRQGEVQLILDSLLILSRTGCGADMDGRSDFPGSLIRRDHTKFIRFPSRYFKILSLRWMFGGASERAPLPYASALTIKPLRPPSTCQRLMIYPRHPYGGKLLFLFYRRRSG